MKFLQLVHTFPPDPGFGVSRFVTEFSRGLGGLGQEVHILPLRPGSRSSSNVNRNVTVHRYEDPYPFKAYSPHLQSVLENLSQGERIVQMEEESGPFDAFLLHGWSVSLASSLGGRVFGNPMMVFLHGTEVGRSLGKMEAERAYAADMERWIAERADRVVVPCEFVRNEVERYYGISKEKIFVLPGGADASTFEVDVDRTEYRRIFAEDKAPVILFSGCLNEVNGVDVLLDTIPWVLQKAPHAKFVIAGDGPLRMSLEARIQNQNLNPHVRLTGHLGNSVLGALYRVADLLVVPSRYEASGLTLLEGNVHALPIVTTDVPGTADWRKKGIPMNRVPSGNPEALAGEMVKILLHQPPSWSKAKPGREGATLRSWKEVAEDFCKIAESLLAPVER